MRIEEDIFNEFCKIEVDLKILIDFECLENVNDFFNQKSLTDEQREDVLLVGDVDEEVDQVDEDRCVVGILMEQVEYQVNVMKVCELAKVLYLVAR